VHRLRGDDAFHPVENVAGREGWLHAVVDFAKPLRMPDFFLISGLFLAQVTDRDWRTYLDRKVIHFAYFYLLWTAVQVAIKAPVLVHDHGPAHDLAVHILVLGAVRHALVHLSAADLFRNREARAQPAHSAGGDLALGSRARFAHIHTGSMVIDEFASRFVYFYTGYLMAAHIFTLAKRVEEQPEMALALLTAWGLINGFLVLHRLAEVPLGSLAPRHGRRGGNSGGSALIASSRIASPVDYFRAQFDRHLPRVLPADGGKPGTAYEDRLDHRCGNRVGARYDRRRGRRAGLVLGGAVNFSALPVRTVGAILDCAQAVAAAAGAVGGWRRALCGSNGRVAKPAPRC
jgi:hypothetical protein